MKKISKAKRAEAVAEIRARLEDLYIGATGNAYDSEYGDLFINLDCRSTGRFIAAISNAFDWPKAENTALVYGLAHWHFDAFESFDTLAEHVYRYTVESR